MENSTRITERKTTVYKSYTNGWKAETVKTVNGQTWKITTSKGYSGNISTSATKCLIMDQGGAITTSITDMLNSSVNLAKEKARATEKTITAQHLKALQVFNETIGAVTEEEAEATKPEEPEIGTILFLDGYGKGQGSEGNKHVVYAIEQGNYSINYKTVELDTLALRNQDHVRPYSEKFGIGTYFIPSYKYEGTAEDLNNLVEAAKAQAIKEDQEREEAAKAAAIETSRKIEEGKKLISLPTGEMFIIVANLLEDCSDPYTDYFASTTVETYYLALSNHKRDLFNEMRKACEGCEIEEIKALATAPDTNENGKTKEEYINSYIEYYNGDRSKAEKAAKDWHPSDERREKYSMGKGYYLASGKYSRSGWQVSKGYINLNDEQTRNKLYIAAAERRIKQPFGEVPKVASSSTNITGSTSNIKIEGTNFELYPTQHSQTGEDIYTVLLTDRTDREEFMQLKKEAKNNGGYYSRYTNLNVSPPVKAGFIFKTEEAAQNFISSVKGEEETTEPEPQKEDPTEIRGEAAPIEEVKEPATAVQEVEEIEVLEVVEEIKPAIKAHEESIAAPNNLKVVSNDPKERTIKAASASIAIQLSMF